MNKVSNGFDSTLLVLQSKRSPSTNGDEMTSPRVFRIAETQVLYPELHAALCEIGAPEWQAKADSSAELLTEFAGKSCYMSFSTELNQNLTAVGTKTNAEYVQNIVKQQHGSVLEHSTVTFFITNVSRVVTHEIVRHRAGTAFSQTSGRYVRGDKVEMYTPECILDNPELCDVFDLAQHQMEENLARLVEISGINHMKDFAKKKELTSAFRRILGNGIANHIVVTANHRAWRHMIEMRTAEGAEEEIRIVFQDIFLRLQDHYPSLYADMTMVNGVVTSQYRKV